MHVAHQKFRREFLLLAGILWITPLLRGQTAATTVTRATESATAEPQLAHHDFFYAGEAQQERMFIVRGGRVAWSYTHPGKGEISDAVLEPNGRIVFAHQYAITEIDQQGKVIWNFDAPPGTEIHTVQRFGKRDLVFIENGNPAKVIIMFKRGKVSREFTLPVAHPEKIHPQFRRIRVTPAGTLLVAHMDLGKVVEYDVTGKQLWSLDAPGLWDAEPLENGNVLISGNNSKNVREVNRAGKTVWEFTAADAPELNLENMQTATRLKNGNTLITQWTNEWAGPVDKAAAPAQAIEVTPAKKVVWVLRSWTPPADLGPSTTIQVLDR
ncbi:MAG TPA: PQQ-binding-like beta-propeller repeat protein [Terracidiphilus sp.]|jgi:outer membrane protein assembly factor BamB